MAWRHFPPRLLDPVLDGGEGDEDAVVAPQVPARVAVGQAVLSHQADGHPLDAERVAAVGQGQVRKVGGETAAATGAAMAGELDQQVDGPLAPRVAEVV